MVKNKFTKFVTHYLYPNKTHVYAYYAIDEEKRCMLQIKPTAEFDVRIPASISGTVIENYENNDQSHMEEISEKQFWQVYKSYTLQLFQYHQEQTAPQIV